MGNTDRLMDGNSNSVLSPLPYDYSAPEPGRTLIRSNCIMTCINKHTKISIILIVKKSILLFYYKNPIQARFLNQPNKIKHR